MGIFDFLLPERKQNSEKLLKKAAEARKLARFREAIRLYEQVIEMEPNNDIAHTGKGNCLIGRGRFDESIKCFDAALNINPENANALHSKGVALKNIGHRDEGEKYIMRANRIIRGEG